MNHIKLGDIALVGIRLLAIYFGILAINSSPVVISTFLSALANGETGIPKPILYITGIQFGVQIAMSITLWLMSNKVASWVLSDQISTSEDGVMSKIDLQSILFCSVGVYILITTLPSIVNWIVMYISTSQIPNRFYIHSGNVFEASIFVLISSLLKLLLSIFLIFNANTFSKLLYKLRYAS